MNVLIVLIVVIVSWVYTYVKTYQTEHFKFVQISTYQLYLNNDAKNKYDKEAREQLCAEMKCMKGRVT